MRVPAGRACSSQADVVAAIADFAAQGRSSAAKILGDFAHKTELGGVRLGLRTTEDAQDAARALLAIAPRVLVEPMADRPVVELIVGVAQDPVLGLHLVVGAGGVLTEILADSAILLFPLDPLQVRAALESLRVWPLLEGYRGGPAAEIEAVIDAVLAIGRFVEAHCDRLLELDINPLFVHPEGEGVTVVDALISIAD